MGASGTALVVGGASPFSALAGADRRDAAVAAPVVDVAAVIGVSRTQSITRRYGL
jgi:hypothetical protein